MYDHRTHHPGRSWSAEQGKPIFPVPVPPPENLASRDGFGSPVPRQPAHLRTQAKYGAYLRDSSRVPRRRSFIYLNRHAPSGQSRVYRVTQLRTDGVHCRESAGTGPVNLKVVPNGCCLGRSPWTSCMTINDIVQYTSVHFTFYLPKPLSLYVSMVLLSTVVVLYL